MEIFPPGTYFTGFLYTFSSYPLHLSSLPPTPSSFPLCLLPHAAETSSFEDKNFSVLQVFVLFSACRKSPLYRFFLVFSERSAPNEQNSDESFSRTYSKFSRHTKIPSTLVYNEFVSATKTRRFIIIFERRPLQYAPSRNRSCHPKHGC